MIKAGIVGISGYSGGETLKILLRHGQIRVTYVSANNSKGKVAEMWPQLKDRTDLVCDTYEAAKAVEMCDVIFLAVPHTVAMGIVPDLLKNKKRVIDLSADYRLTSVHLYKKWYGREHTDPGHLSEAVYGLPELYREKIRNAALVANPGCYPTAAILGLAPLVSTRAQNLAGIIIDAKSGVSGAGKKLASNMMFAEVNENFGAYKVLQHQHTPEMEQVLSRLAGQDISLTFVTHLLPVTRGIQETIYVLGREKLPSSEEIHSVYQKFYKTEPFVRVLPPGGQPELKHVNHTNYCDIGLVKDEDKNILVITTAIDNLVKGAAGQAVQNMNIMYHFDEAAGLNS